MRRREETKRFPSSPSSNKPNAGSLQDQSPKGRANKKEPAEQKIVVLLRS
jgi:hypothetical protein